MIKIDDISKIVKLVLLSGFLKKTKPLSLLLVGEVGIGKTEISTHFSTTRASFISDISKMGLYNELLEHKQLKHIIIPDFIKITQRKRATSDDLISALNSAVEEGLSHISLYKYAPSFKNRNIGLITSTTKASYSQNKQKWEHIGFLSRMLVVSYSYSETTIKEIMDYITNEKYLNDKDKEKLGNYKSNIDVTSAQEFNQQLLSLHNNKFRTQKQLQILLKCHALFRHSTKVNQEDVDEIKRLSKYLNLNYTKI